MQSQLMYGQWMLSSLHMGGIRQEHTLLHILCETAPNTTNNCVRFPDADVLILLLKNAKDFNSVILFDTGTGDTYKENSVKSSECKRYGSHETLSTLCILEPLKRILWQTVKTQMKCSTMLHFIGVCTICYDKKSKWVGSGNTTITNYRPTHGTVRTSKAEVYSRLKISTCGSFKYIMNNSTLIVCIYMGKSIRIQRATITILKGYLIYVTHITPQEVVLLFKKLSCVVKASSGTTISVHMLHTRF